MGQMLVPAMIGAGVGAVGGAAMGKNPFKTALLGAGVGAAGAGAGLFGSAGAAGATGATGATGIQLVQAPIVEGLATSLTPTVVGGSGAAGITGLGTQSLGGAGITGLGSLGGGGAAITGLNTIPIDAAVNYGDLSRLAYDTPLSFGERFFNLGSSGYSYLKDNPATALSGVNSLSNLSNQADQAKQQRLNEAVATGDPLLPEI
jgi:hypothetical protein